MVTDVSPGLNSTRPNPTTRNMPDKIQEAVLLVSTAMREGMLTTEQTELLENGGFGLLKTESSTTDMLDQIKALADALLKSMVNERGALKETDADAMNKQVTTLLRMLEQLRKQQSEAKSIDTFKALEMAMHECLQDLVAASEGQPWESSVNDCLAEFRESLEEKLKAVQRKYDEG